MARVVITRPADAAGRTAARGRALGHEVLLAPVIAIVERADALPALTDVQAVLVTSRNAAPAAARLPAAVAILAVGGATARALADAGRPASIVAEGDGTSLARLVRASLHPADGALLHATGEHTAGSLADDLAAAGFAYRRWIVYRAEAVTALAKPARSALAAGTVDAVTLHSPRSARLFTRLAHEDGVAAGAGHAWALCLSANVAAAAADLPWRGRWIAAYPDENGMGGLLEDLIHRC